MKFILNWALLFLLCVLVRLPYLLGNHVYFDGDEAIIGIMAQDVLRGESFPLYFYGQQYGFSLFEVLSAAFFMLFFGNGVMTLKLAGLLIFSFGFTFIFRGLKNLQINGSLALVLMLAAAVFPIWFLWAAKVRGGYVTAFSAMAVVFYLATKKEYSFKTIILSGICIAITAVSHLLMLLPFVGILFYVFSKKISWKKGLVWFSVIIAALFLLKIPAYANEELWAVSPKLNFDYITLKSSLYMFPNIYMGYFYYDYIFGMQTNMTVFFYIQIIFFLYLLYKRLKSSSNSEKLVIIFTLIGIILSFFSALLIDEKAYRYWLSPITAFAFLYFFLFYSWLAENTFRFPKSIFFLFIFIIPACFFNRIPAFWQAPQSHDMAELKELNHIIADKNITAIFCTDALLTWQINYYGRDKYVARYLFKKDRTNTFIEKVNTCYTSGQCKTALVGVYGSALGMDTLAGWHDSIIYVGQRFYLQPQVKAEFLKQAGFEMP